jgi:predicted CoA-substrate-specific enzyme activase
MKGPVVLPFSKVIAKAEGRIGIDVGSRSVKVCSMIGGRMSLGIADTAEAIFSGLGRFPEGSEIVATGYGRGKVAGARTIPEVRAHAVGALGSVDMDAFTLLDIGGQDFKVVRIEDRGIRDFSMNDKCAAGTGRFFEAMARIFRMELGEFSDLSLKAKKTLAVTAQCSVFAETEVISLLAKKNPPADIAAGIQSAVAKRCFTLLKRVGINPKVTITGGCAKNRGLVKELEKVLKVDIAPLPVDPQIIGALGAAVYARKKHTGM